MIGTNWWVKSFITSWAIQPPAEYILTNKMFSMKPSRAKLVFTRNLPRNEEMECNSTPPYRQNSWIKSSLMRELEPISLSNLETHACNRNEIQFIRENNKETYNLLVHIITDGQSLWGNRRWVLIFSQGSQLSKERRGYTQMHESTEILWFT